MKRQPHLDPNAARLLELAAQCLRAGRQEAALAPLREAARLAPGNAAIWHDLGLACLECGLIEESVGALRASVAASPRYADAHLRLGIALEAAGAVPDALAAYRRAANLQPTLADARYRAGELLVSLGRMREAIEAYRRAAASAPASTLGRMAAAKALLAEDRDAEAEVILREILLHENDNAAALDALGNLLADAGRFDEARACLLRAIEAAPLRAGSYYDVVRCRRIGPHDAALLARMRAALALPNLEPAQRARVHLALGKAADDLGDAGEAMRQFDAAEALRNAIVRFDPAAFEARVERLIACFSRDIFAGAAAARQDAPAPVFIVGLPRSGTTLVEQIVSAHPQVHAGGEMGFWNERGRDWEERGGGVPRPIFLADAAADYRRLLRGMAPRAACVTDKMPLNFQWAGLIHLAMPLATIIHCRRNPLDTALSIHKTHFNPRMAFPTGGAALVGYVRAYQRLCAHWRHVLPAERFIEVEYEALTGDPESVIPGLVGACGLAWDAACLRPERSPRVIKTPSKWQARQPIYRTSVESWRAYEPWLGPLAQLRTP